MFLILNDALILPWDESTFHLNSVMIWKEAPTADNIKILNFHIVRRHIVPSAPSSWGPIFLYFRGFLSKKLENIAGASVSRNWGW